MKAFQLFCFLYFVQFFQNQKMGELAVIHFTVYYCILMLMLFLSLDFFMTIIIYIFALLMLIFWELIFDTTRFSFVRHYLTKLQQMQFSVNFSKGKRRKRTPKNQIKTNKNKRKMIGTQNV